MEQAAPGGTGARPAFPGWDLLRALGGEVAEVSALAAGEHAEAGETILASGRFEAGGLFQATFLPGRPGGETRLVVVGDRGRAELAFPVGWAGPAFLDWTDESGEPREEAWDAWDPWPALAARFESAVAGQEGYPTWLDAVRGLELDDAARRSVERRRSSVLEYQEASEETGFKGTMTLVGCGLLWGMLLLLVMSYWFPPIRWLIVGLLVIFLGLQFLRYIIPSRRDKRGDYARVVIRLVRTDPLATIRATRRPVRNREDADAQDAVLWVGGPGPRSVVPVGARPAAARAR